MKNISCKQIEEAVEAAFLKANVDVTKISTHLEKIKQNEKNEIAISIIDDLIKNAKVAKQLNIPSCQDTGMAVVFCEIGQNVCITDGDINQAINQGVKQAYQKGYFRKSVVDPISRINTKDNTPAIIHYEMIKGENIIITVLPKGFGSENMSDIKMLVPAAGKQGIIDFIIDTVKNKGANACPPLVVGVGIGGTFEKCAYLAKKSLARDIGIHSQDIELKDMEIDLLNQINKLDIGPMGLGGNITALAVNIEKFPTHIAGMPVAVNMMCHALRHERVVL